MWSILGALAVVCLEIVESLFKLLLHFPLCPSLLEQVSDF